jgi:hypothetical protein
MSDFPTQDDKNLWNDFVIAVKWYLAPHWSILLTGPALLVLLFYGVIYTWQALATVYSGVFLEGFRAPSLFLVPILSLINFGILWTAFFKIPKTGRASCLGGLQAMAWFLGAIVGTTLIDMFRNYMIALAR